MPFIPLDPVLHPQLSQSGHAEAAGGSDRTGRLHLRSRQRGDQGGGGDKDRRRTGPHYHRQWSWICFHQGEHIAQDSSVGQSNISVWAYVF